MVQFLRYFKAHSNARHCSLFYSLLFQFRFVRFEMNTSVCESVCIRWKVLIFAWNCYLATQTNKSNKKCVAFYRPPKTNYIFAHCDDGFLYTQQISYYNFLRASVCECVCVCDVHDVICVLCVYLTIYHEFLLRIFDARVSLLYSNIRNTQANKLSIRWRWHSSLFPSAIGLFNGFVFVVFFFSIQFDYKRSNFFRSNITHSHTHTKYFSTFRKFCMIEKVAVHNVRCTFFPLYMRCCL